jgi:hypothetical protein
VGYAGFVTFSSSDSSNKVTLPAGSKLTGGIGVFSATLVTAGNQKLTATDSTAHIAATSGPIAVSAAAATHFAITAPDKVSAGVVFHFTVTAEDRFNNVATGYVGTVHFTSSETLAVLPAYGTLTGGLGTFSAILFTKACGQTLQAADVVNTAIKGISNKIDVKGDAKTAATNALSLAFVEQYAAGYGASTWQAEAEYLAALQALYGHGLSFDLDSNSDKSENGHRTLGVPG